MNIRTLAILAALIAIPVAAQTMMAQTVTIHPTTTGPATETRTFALKQGGKLKISGVGNIKISAWDRDEVSLMANFVPSTRLRQHHSIEVKSNINSLGLTVKRPPRKEINEIGIVHLNLYVPSHIIANVQTRYGSVAIDSVIGKIRAETRYGNLSFKNISGDFESHTRYGSISLENINADLVASTRYGSITGVRQSEGENQLDLSTSYGNITINLRKSDDKFDASVETGTLDAETPGSVEAKDLRYTFASPDETKINTGATSNSKIPYMKLRTKHGSIVVR